MTLASSVPGAFDNSGQYGLLLHSSTHSVLAGLFPLCPPQILYIQFLTHRSHVTPERNCFPPFKPLQMSAVFQDSVQNSRYPNYPIEPF